MDEIKARVEVLRPMAGDMLVFQFPRRLTMEQRDHIGKWLKPLVPEGVNLVLLDPDVSLQHVVAPTNA